MRGFGGTGAWGMFAALIAVCTLLLAMTDGHRKTAKNLDAGYTLSAEAPTMPLIVVSDPTAVLAASPYIVGLTNAGVGLETGIYRHPTACEVYADPVYQLIHPLAGIMGTGSGVSATVLILHQVAADSCHQPAATYPGRRNQYARKESTVVIRFVRAQTWNKARA